MSELEGKKVATKEVKETKAKKTAQPKKRVVVDRNLEVVFMNNTSGTFFYKCPKTQNIYELGEYGDVDYITVDELMFMRNSHRKILNEMWILLTDVVSDEVTLDDVLKYLGIEDLYGSEMNPLDMDGFILKSTDAKFESASIKMSPQVLKKVAERAYVLYKKKKFTSMTKADVLKQLMKNDELFD